MQAPVEHLMTIASTSARLTEMVDDVEQFFDVECTFDVKYVIYRHDRKNPDLRLGFYIWHEDNLYYAAIGYTITQVQNETVEFLKSNPELYHPKTEKDKAS